MKDEESAAIQRVRQYITAVDYDPSRMTDDEVLAFVQRVADKANVMSAASAQDAAKALEQVARSGV